MIERRAIALIFSLFGWGYIVQDGDVYLLGAVMTNPRQPQRLPASWKRIGGIPGRSS